MKRTLSYGRRPVHAYKCNHDWPMIVCLNRRDRVYLIPEKRKLRNEIARIKQTIRSNPEIHWVYLDYKKDLEQELLEITTELENLCA